MHCRIDETEWEDPDKISQSPLTFEGFAPSVSFFVVSVELRVAGGCVAMGYMGLHST